MTQEQKSVFKPVVRNVQNNDAYFYAGDNVFENIRTGGNGNVDDETAKRIFKINPAASEIINEYPLVADLIQKLNLRFDNNKK